MISQTIYRAFNILKLEKNTYEEISKDGSSIYGSGITIFAAGLVNVYLFKHFIQPTLPNEIPLTAIFLIWIFFNWYVFSNIMLKIVKLFGGSKNLESKKFSFNL